MYIKFQMLINNNAQISDRVNCMKNNIIYGIGMPLWLSWALDLLLHTLPVKHFCIAILNSIQSYKNTNSNSEIVSHKNMIRYDRREFNVDSNAEYLTLSSTRTRKKN